MDDVSSGKRPCNSGGRIRRGHHSAAVGLAGAFLVGITFLGVHPEPEGSRSSEPSAETRLDRQIEFASSVPIPKRPIGGFATDPRGEPYVSFWRERLTRAPGRLLDAYLVQTEPWRGELLPILSAHSVPPEFLYLALVESGMDRDARSPADAVGMWQFTVATALQYGLVVDGEVDERHDARLATYAAGRYLRDLHRRFGSWELAAAAYNAGPSRIERALLLSGAESYWELIELSYLPAETRAYVPRFLATVQLAAERTGEWNVATRSSAENAAD